jgi:hypothetical protein
LRHWQPTAPSLVLWLLEWSSCEKLCMLANDNKDCLNVWFFNIFFKPETELVVAWLRWSLHPLLVYRSI